MRKDDRRRFVALLTSCAEMYGRDISPGAMELWWNALERFDLEAVERAIARHMQSPDSGKFMPKPADIILIIEGTSGDAAHTAWAAVDRAVRTVGPYPSVTFDDPLTMRVISDMGGWTRLGEKSVEEWPFVGNEFVARYTAFKQSGQVPEYPAKLIGLSEAENASRGLAHMESVLIGDQAKAGQVRLGGQRNTGSAVHRIGEMEEVKAIGANVVKMRSLQ